MTQLPLVLVGCSFRNASTRWRAALALPPEERSALADRLANQGATGFAVLETCNRTLWLASSDRPAWTGELLRAQVLQKWRQLAGQADGSLPPLQVLLGQDAARHLLRVSVGLESFVVGEREIAGQLQASLADARTARHSSPALNVLSSCVGRSVRRVERLTRLRASGSGVHTLARDAVLDGVPSGDSLRVGVAGLGSIGRKAAASLEAAGLQVARFNRTPDPTRDWRPLSELREAVPALDALVVCTGAPSAVLTDAHLGLSHRSARAPLLVIDIGSPTQVVLDDSATPNALLLGLDDLLEREQRGADAEQVARAEALVEEGLHELRLSVAKRSLKRLVERNHHSFDDLAWRRLPEILDAHLPPAAVGGRRSLEQELRQLLRSYNRSVLSAIEETVLEPPAGSDEGSLT